MKPYRNTIHFYLNGKLEEVSGNDAMMPLAEYLRYKKGLTGTKVVCAEGDCGACTVLRAKPSQTPQAHGQPLRFEPINSCIALVCQMDGGHLVSVEGLKHENELSPAQTAMRNCHGSQCGYCTPGFVMAISGMLERTSKVTPKTAQNYLTGNLCRCTGYQPIIEAAVCAADLSKKLPKAKSLTTRYLTSANLKDLKDRTKTSVVTETQTETQTRRFLAPSTEKDLKAFLKKYKNMIILGATTDLGVQYNKAKHDLINTLSLHKLSSLTKITLSSGKIRVGSQVTLSELRRALEKPAPKLAQALDLFASPQIKNAATLAGNVANASPIADTPPFLLTLNAQVEVLSGRAKKTYALNDFYLGYRKTKLKPGEIITAITFDLPQKDEVFYFYKNSQRKDLDISCVNAAFLLKSNKDIRIAMGGVAATPLRLKKTEAFLKKQKLAHEAIPTAITHLQNEITPISDLRGTQAYRRVLAESIFREFFDKNLKRNLKS